MNTNNEQIWDGKVTILTKEGKKISRSKLAIRHVGKCIETEVDTFGDIVNRVWKFWNEIVYKRKRCKIESVNDRVWKIID